MPCPIFRARHLLCKKESTAFTQRMNLPAGGAANPITQHFPFCEAEFRPPKFCLTAILPAEARPSSPIEKKRRESTIGTLSFFGADDGTCPPAGGAANPITQRFPFCEAEFRPPKFCLTAMLPAGARPSSPIEKKRRESTIGTLSSFGADDGT